MLGKGPMAMTTADKNGPVTMEWLMDDAIEADAGLSLARMTVAIGQVSELHAHSNCTEAIHVLVGRIEQRRGDEWLELAAGDTCLIPKGVKHQTRNVGPERAVLMLAYSSGSRQYETE